MSVGGRPLKFSSPEDLLAKGQEFFDLCEKTGRPITITGLAYHLDTTRETLCDYQEKDGFSDTVKKLKSRCELFAEEKLYTPGQAAAGPIFALKNFGWKDKIEQEHSGNLTVSTPQSDVAKRFLERQKGE